MDPEMLTLYIGCIFFFSFHGALSQPVDFNSELPISENPLKPYFAHRKFHSFQRSNKEDDIGVVNYLPPGFTEFSGCANFKSAYKLYESKATWKDALLACYLDGAYLGFPRCAAEGRRFHRLLRRANNGGAWIGISDLMEEGNWVTVSNEREKKLDYVNWAAIEPNNFMGEDCAEIYDKDGQWYDTSCEKKLFYFCKIDIAA